MHKLEQIRQGLRITKTEMARRLGIAKSNYSMIIHGQHGVSKKVALRAYQEFGVPLEVLLCPAGSPADNSESDASRPRAQGDSTYA